MRFPGPLTGISCWPVYPDQVHPVLPCSCPTSCCCCQPTVQAHRTKRISISTRWPLARPRSNWACGHAASGSLAWGCRAMPRIVTYVPYGGGGACGCRHSRWCSLTCVLIRSTTAEARETGALLPFFPTGISCISPRPQQRHRRRSLHSHHDQRRQLLPALLPLLLIRGSDNDKVEHHSIVK